MRAGGVGNAKWCPRENPLNHHDNIMLLIPSPLILTCCSTVLYSCRVQQTDWHRVCMVDYSLARQVRPSRPASARSFSTLGLSSEGYSRDNFSPPASWDGLYVLHVLLNVLVIIIINHKCYTGKCNSLHSDRVSLLVPSIQSSPKVENS